MLNRVVILATMLTKAEYIVMCKGWANPRGSRVRVRRVRVRVRVRIL